MKKIVLLLLVFSTATALFAQKKVKKKTTKTSTVKTKKVKVVEQNPYLTEMYIINDNGETTLEPLKRGDKLIYEVNANGNKYDFMVILNEFNYEKGIDFNYEMTNAKRTKGHVMISREAKSGAKKYINYFAGGDLILTDASSVWMSYENFMDMSTKKTVMTFDNGIEETFYRPENDETRPTIIYKGKIVKLDAFIINNAQDGKGAKTLTIQNTSANPLIIKMDIGFTIELKEIK